MLILLFFEFPYFLIRLFFGYGLKFFKIVYENALNFHILFKFHIPLCKPSK